MAITAVAHCSQCGAVVNVHWPACLVCQTALESRHLPDPLQDSGTCSGKSPEPPICSGWLVTYRDRHGKLCGGSEDRAHGTVQECRWDGMSWTVHLTDGQRLPLSLILAVGKTDSTGRILAPWAVREHGYDGEGPT